jgi:hypothetical protein
MRAIVTGVGVVGLALVLAGCDLGQRPVRVNRVPGMDVAAGDVDGDGDGDLVSVGWYTTTNSGAIAVPEYTVLRSDGAGGFTPVDGPDDHDVLTMTMQVTLADLDEGALDLVRVLEHVVGGSFDEDLAVNLGDGTGGFAAQEIIEDPGFVDDSDGLATGDVNDDGHVDVVMLGDSSVNVYLGDGTGGMADPVTVPAPPELIDLDDLALADLDSDGDLDIVTGATTCVPVPPGGVPNCGGAFVAVPAFFVVRGDGSGTQWAPERVTLAHDPLGGAGRGVAVGDVDGDDVPDLVTGYAQRIVVATGRPDGSYVEVPVPLPGIDKCPDLEDVVTTDIDRDGDLDLVAMGGCGEGALLRGDGAGAFSGPRPLVFQDAGPTKTAPTTELVAGDLTGDGRLDLALGSSWLCACGQSTDPSVGVMVNALG